MGSGFKNWRPSKLVGATRAPDGTLVGGRIALAANVQISDFALTQYFGTELLKMTPRPADSQWRARDAQLVYNGFDLATDLLTTHERAATQCVVSYRRSDGSEIRFGYEEARRRLFAMSFDPHHCVERR